MLLNCGIHEENEFGYNNSVTSNFPHESFEQESSWCVWWFVGWSLLFDVLFFICIKLKLLKNVQFDQVAPGFGEQDKDESI